MSIVQILVLVARSLTEILLIRGVRVSARCRGNQPRMTEVEKGSMLQLSATWVSQS